MYGQMTAGSWIYIGSQGIVQGTFETFAECAERHFGGTLAGRLVLTAGLGGMGGAQPLAATMNGGVCLAIEVDEARAQRRVETRLLRPRDALARRGARVVPRGDGGEAAAVASGSSATPPRSMPELLRRGVMPDVATDQTSAHDPLNGYVPAGLTLEQAAGAARARPDEVVRRARDVDGHARARAARHEGARARCCSTTATTCAARRRRAGCREAEAFSYPGFVPEYIRPLFCVGKGPFRWAALSGDPADIARHRRRGARRVPRRRAAAPLDPAGAEARPLPGPAGAHLLAGLRRAPPAGPALQPHGARGRAARRRSSSAATTSTRARSPRRIAKPRPCATAATRSPTGRS